MVAVKNGGSTSGARRPSHLGRAKHLARGVTGTGVPLGLDWHDLYWKIIAGLKTAKLFGSTVSVSEGALCAMIFFACSPLDTSNLRAYQKSAA